MKYLVEITAEAEKEMARLDRVLERRIRERLRGLAADPYSSRISKSLRMGSGERSARVGNWRVIYEVHDSDGVIRILAIRPRQEAYRKL